LVNSATIKGCRRRDEKVHDRDSRVAIWIAVCPQAAYSPSLAPKAEEHPMATNAAILRGLGRGAMRLEKALLKLLDNWMRQQVAHLHGSVSRPRRNN
jgi:hypothetical protein